MDTNTTSEKWTEGIHHVGLSVPDIERTRGFFVETLGFSEVARKPDYPAVFVSDGVVMLTLWQVRDPASALPFDRERHVGLHHLALSVADHAALETLHARLVARDDVTIEFAPEPLGASGLRHLMCSAPGGIRLELVAGAAA